ncbi:MAG: hypothetical protein BGO10_01110 [Chlamydia sp. 32-24]|nr:MAG: hypothetical protein BGO10_01110 [Chlamydia sp. 32-24]
MIKTSLESLDLPNYTPLKSNFTKTQWVYPLKKLVKACLLTSENSWFGSAQEEIRKLHQAILNKKVSSFLKNYVDYSNTENYTYTKSNLPFFIKTQKETKNHIDESIQRVISAQRAKNFTIEENLDRIYIPNKFLIITDPNNDNLHSVAIVEKVILAKDPQKTWNKLSDEIKGKQKIQMAYFILRMGYKDSHDGNIVLLKDGRFAVIDFDEPFLLSRKIFQSLVNQDNSISLRLQELKNGKYGLNRWLKFELTSCELDSHTNETIYNRMYTLLKKEKKKLKIDLLVQKTLRITYFKSVNSKDRVSNLEKRAFYKYYFIDK